MNFLLIFHSLWCRKDKYEKVSECLQIIRLESKYDRNPSFIVRSQNKYDRDSIFIISLRNKYDRNPSFCDVTTFLCGVCYQCYDQYTLITWLIPLFFVFTVTNITISIGCSNWRYDQFFRLELTLQLLFSTSTDNQWCHLWPYYRRYNPYSQFFAPSYLLMLIISSNYRMLVVFIHKIVFF